MASTSTFGKQTTSEEVAEVFANVIKGKTIVITGVSPNGLGEAMVKALARHDPAKLILTARTISKAEAVIANIKQNNASKQTDMQTLTLDLSSLESVRKGAAELAQRIDSIDILINNAGVMAVPERTLSVDGHEMHFATNFLGHFLFINLLKDKLVAKARIVNITSGGYMTCPIRFSDLRWDKDIELPEAEQPNYEILKAMGVESLTDKKPYAPFLAYLHANAAAMLFTVGLNKRFADKNVHAYSSAPGVVLTELQRHMGGFVNPNLEYKTASAGASSFLVAALDPVLEDQPGAYINDCKVETIISDHVQSEEVADRLWDVAEGITGLKHQ